MALQTHSFPSFARLSAPGADLLHAPHLAPVEGGRWGPPAGKRREGGGRERREGREEEGEAGLLLPWFPGRGCHFSALGVALRLSRFCYPLLSLNLNAQGWWRLFEIRWGWGGECCRGHCGVSGRHMRGSAEKIWSPRQADVSRGPRRAGPCRPPGMCEESRGEPTRLDLGTWRLPTHPNLSPTPPRCGLGREAVCLQGAQRLGPWVQLE